MDSLSSEEVVRVIPVLQTVKKHGQVMVIVQFFNFDLPRDFVPLCVMFDSDREVSSLVELLELCFFTGYARLEGAGCWSFDYLKIQ